MYLIFFGKAQSFIFYAFDENGIVANFNKIIPDLDLLESQLLNVDREDNKDIVGKYIFAKGGPDPYSLIKIYSPAQPSQGFRIEGCIYGVAFLSKSNLKISKGNTQILHAIQKAFGSIVLSGIKFLNTDFKDEATKIFLSFKNQNGFSKIESTKQFDSLNSNTTNAIYVDDLLNFDIDISNFSNRIYITEDIDRLLRAQKKWGEKSIKILQKVNNSFMEYRPIQQISALKDTQSESNIGRQENGKPVANNNDSEKVMLKLKIQDIEKQFIIADQKLNKALASNQNTKIILKVIIAVFLLTTIIMGYLTYNHFKSDQNKKEVHVNQPKSESEETPNIMQNITINNTLDVMQKWEKKKELVDFVNLIIQLEAEKNANKKETIKTKITKKGLENEMDTATINIFLKNI